MGNLSLLLHIHTRDKLKTYCAVESKITSGTKNNKRLAQFANRLYQSEKLKVQSARLIPCASGVV